MDATPRHRIVNGWVLQTGKMTEKSFVLKSYSFYMQLIATVRDIWVIKKHNRYTFLASASTIKCLAIRGLTDHHECVPLIPGQSPPLPSLGQMSSLRQWHIVKMDLDTWYHILLKVMKSFILICFCEYMDTKTKFIYVTVITGLTDLVCSL